MSEPAAPKIAVPFTCPTCAENRIFAITPYDLNLDVPTTTVTQAFRCNMCGTAWTQFYQFTSVAVRGEPLLIFSPNGHRMAALDALRQAITFYIGAQGEPDELAELERLGVVLRALSAVFGPVPEQDLYYPPPPPPDLSDAQIIHEIVTLGSTQQIAEEG